MSQVAHEWRDWPGDVLTKTSSDNMTGPRKFHVFSDCPIVDRYGMRRKPRNVLFHDSRMCGECQKLIREGRVPDVR